MQGLGFFFLATAVGISKINVDYFCVCELSVKREKEMKIQMYQGI